MSRILGRFGRLYSNPGSTCPLSSPAIHLDPNWISASMCLPLPGLLRLKLNLIFSIWPHHITPWRCVEILKTPDFFSFLFPFLLLFEKYQRALCDKRHQRVVSVLVLGNINKGNNSEDHHHSLLRHRDEGQWREMTECLPRLSVGRQRWKAECLE